MNISNEELEYNHIYGKLPNTQDEIIEHLMTGLNPDIKKLEEEEKRIRELEWIEKEYTIYLVPKGTPRPRTSYGSSVFYVKGAKQTRKLFERIIEEEGFICTRIDFLLEAYFPTPISSMSKIEIILAEKGLIKPIAAPDFDNLAKTYTDPLQGVLILNDNLINPGRVEKYYSIKPRINIKIRYQSGFDSNYNKRKTLNSISYKKLTGGNI